MSSIGVVVLRNSALGNAQILHESLDNATNINNNDKPKREIIIVRKKQKIQPQQTVSVTSLVRAAESNAPEPTPPPPPPPPVAPAPARAKRPRVRDDTADEGRAPAPLAVARRNARERNRVRQVNNGFAALRRHIPEEVAEAFESANSSRGTNKKLSKVETLRMAVEYIRNLESLLNIGPGADKENSSRTGAESFPSPASSSPRDASFEQSYFSLNSPALDEDDDEMDGPLPTLARHQYARIPDAFHPGSIHLYEEDENVQPATPASDLIAHDDLLSPQLLDASFQFINSAEHFTVIHPDNFGSEADFDEVASEMDIKYSETLRLADVDADTLGDESALGGLSTIDPQLVLPQPQYRLLEEDISAGGMMEESCGLELKRELPDTHVCPEDRQQFEETLKWWQEKTRSGRPVLVSRDRAD